MLSKKSLTTKRITKLEMTQLVCHLRIASSNTVSTSKWQMLQCRYHFCYKEHDPPASGLEPTPFDKEVQRFTH